MVAMVELGEQGPAVKALGSLFKLTEVFLWDDGSKETKDKSSFLERTKPARNGGVDGSSVLDSECGTLPEDMELTKQMNALGLPVSFNTNKEKRNRNTEGRRKGMRLKHPDISRGNVDLVVEALESSKVSVGEIVSPLIFDGNTGTSLCCMSMMGQSESSSSDVAAGAITFQCPSVEGDNLASSTEITSHAVKEQDHDGILGVFCNDGQDCDSSRSGAVLNDLMKIAAGSTDLYDGICPGSCVTEAAGSHEKREPGEVLMLHDHLEHPLMVPEQGCVSESVSYSMSSEVLDHDGTDSQDNGDFGDWMAYWDSYYLRNYFYNIRTHTSTWFPPPGMEHLATIDTTYKSNEVIAEVTEMDVSTDLKATNFCSLSKTESFEESTNDDVSQGQLYHELSRELELTVNDSVSDTTVPTVTANRFLEHSDELDESNSTYNDGNPECLSSNLQVHIASFRNKTKQLLADEVCNSDLQPIFAEETDELNTIHLYNEPNTTCEENIEDCEDDDAFRILDTSSLSNTTYTEEVCVDSNMHSGTGVPVINELEMQRGPAVVQRKKKVRRMQIQRKLSNENEDLLFQGLFKEFSADIGKYWNQRYLLFSRYDDGIEMDEEGWFSVTPETLARHHAERCGSGIIVDCFTGVGGNSIQFAQISKHVTAIDIDPKKIDYAHHNAAIYGVDDRIDFVKGDFFRLAPKLKADTVFLSPPWGGPDYVKVKTYDIKTMLKPCDGFFLFNTAKEVASRIVMFLPRNVDVNQLAELALSGGQPWSLEVEKNFLNGKLKGVTAYFSDTTG